MRKLLSRMWHETDGVLSFEWTVLASLLTIGAVAGIASVRDAMVDEMSDLSQAMVSLDQSYRIQGPLVISVHTLDPYPGRVRVYEFPRRGGGSVSLATDTLAYGGSTAAGSGFIDVPARIIRERPPEVPPADGLIPPGAPAPEAQGFNLPGPSFDE